MSASPACRTTGTGRMACDHHAIIFLAQPRNQILIPVERPDAHRLSPRRYARAPCRRAWGRATGMGLPRRQRGHSWVFSVMPSQSHGQSDVRMRIVIAWQVADNHLLVLLKRQFHDIGHEIYAGLHELEISTVDIQQNAGQF